MDLKDWDKHFCSWCNLSFGTHEVRYQAGEDLYHSNCYAEYQSAQRKKHLAVRALAIVPNDPPQAA